MSLLFGHSVPLLFSGSGFCLPSLLPFCSIIISWFHLVSGTVPGFASLLLWHSVPSSFPASFWFQLGFRILSPYFSLLSFVREGILFHHDFLVFLVVLARVPGLVSLLFFCFLSQEKGRVPSWFSGSFWFPARVPGLSPFFSFVSFLKSGATNELFIANETSWKHGLLLFGVYACVIWCLMD